MVGGLSYYTIKPLILLQPHTTQQGSFSTSHADAQWPPSILRSAPVIQELAGASKKIAGPLKSAGAPKRPSIAPLIQVSSISGSSCNSLSVIAVLIYPGDKVLTRMPYFPHSWAKDRDSCSTAALLVL